MDKIPKRTKLARPYRVLLDRFEGVLVFPLKNPSHYQVIALLLSIYFLFLGSTVSKIVMLIVILVLDWYDGAAARKFGLANREGWMIDVAVDRVSEMFMFIPLIGTPLGQIAFGMAVLNILLAVYSIKSGRHILLALRFFYLVVLVISLITKWRI